jgi:hypothetical protein
LRWSSLTFCPGWSPTAFFLISISGDSRVTRIIGMGHHVQTPVIFRCRCATQISTQKENI